jgi:serine carboxypeptidase-like clade 1
MYIYIMNFQCTDKIFFGQILEPTCQNLSPKRRGSKWDPEALYEDSLDLLQSISNLHEPERWCRVKNDKFVYIYIYSIN